MSLLSEKDYVLRLIREAAEAIARALKLGSGGKTDEALEELEKACPTLLGVDFATLASVDSGSAAALLRDGHRVRAFASLLEAAGELHAGAGNTAMALSRRQHALEIWLEALAQRRTDEALEHIRRLRAEVPLERLPAKYREQLEALG